MMVEESLSVKLSKSGLDTARLLLHRLRTEGVSVLPPSLRERATAAMSHRRGMSIALVLELALSDLEARLGKEAR